MEQASCPRCGAATSAGDAYCAACGTALVTPRLVRRRGRWGRRLATIVLLILLVGAAAVTGIMLRASSAAHSIQVLSQPPASLPGSALGLSGVRQIDTQPARLAISAGPATEPASNWWNGVSQAVAGVPETVSGVAVAAGAQSTTPEPMTILLLGVDARPGDAIDVGVRADAMALLHLDPEDRSCRLLAIPRDARAELPGYGPSKINHALAVGGVPYQIQVVEDFLGLAIDRYALADFRGFAAVVDAVGGVTLTVPEPFNAGAFSFEAGEHRFTGDEALAYVQYRGGADGDFGRITRQQQMLRAIADEATGLDLVRGISQILPAVEGHLRTDLSPVELTSLIATYQASCGSDELAMETLAGETATFFDPLVGEELSYVVIGDDEKAARLATLLGEGE